jgi:acetylornithine deacetylase/succinyl-diaminopimelate desuccinylase-like protein
VNTADQERLVGWLQALVRRPSPQTALMEAEPAVTSFIAEGVRPILAGAGHAGRLDAMGNLIVEAGPADARRCAMILTYAMTHPASSMREPFAGELVGDAVRGRGTTEQKGALAAAIHAFVSFSKSSPRIRTLLAVSTAGETGQHKAAESILSSLDRVPEVCIVAIGTGGKVSLANKCRVDVHVDVTGKASHSSTPWLGVDAIAGATAVIERLRGLDLGGEHPLLGRATLTPTAIRSWPEATHTIQNRVAMTFDRRLLPGDDPDPAVAAIREALKDLKPWGIEVRAGALQFPAELPRDGAFMRCATAGNQRMNLGEPQTFISHGCVDAGLLVKRGCEAAMWGPGEQAMWHTDEERLPVSALAESAAAYLGFLQAFQERL